MRQFLLLVFLVNARANLNTGSQRNTFHCYLPGLMSSSSGTGHVDVQRLQEMKTITDLMEGRFREFKEETQAKVWEEFKSFTSMMQSSFNTYTTTIATKIDTIEQEVFDGNKKTAVYTHWGKKTCAEDADLVLSGFTGGSWHGSIGAATNPICLPQDPEWGIYKDGIDLSRAYVYGAEYKTDTFTGFMTILNNQDVPCAICLTRDRSVVKMFPARKNCYMGWKMEYRGYLMAGQHEEKSGSKYICIDGNSDALHGGQDNQDGYLFYPVEGHCGSLKCPPYVDGRELVCVVCSK